MAFALHGALTIPRPLTIFCYFLLFFRDSVTFTFERIFDEESLPGNRGGAWSWNRANSFGRRSNCGARDSQCFVVKQLGVAELAIGATAHFATSHFV